MKPNEQKKRLGSHKKNVTPHVVHLGPDHAQKRNLAG